ncbi:Stealth CR1 domain-containing protein [Mariniflexile sp. HNIBRBA6329]|uniref:Stealth CR1 domain-containing protein n=1 Tax=Mariniflexile sp. HNIBRBA6329 TaxID=3373088 RepID=UPI0037467239
MRDQSLDICIDAVIPWVDGNDTNWQKKINEHLEIKIDFNKKKESVRFNSIGEIDIAIKSIIKFAPYFRNIFLVTDNQKPESFDTLSSLAKSKDINLILIDHKIIFKGFEEYLPCFCSCSIETMFFKIPDLSEHFVIFNDDFFLMRETKPSDFFINGYPIIRGRWKKFNEDKKLRKFYHNVLSFLGKSKIKKGASFKGIQQKGAKLAGTNKYIRHFHAPYSVRKSVLVNYFKENDLADNIKYRFRNKKQFVIYSLADHLEIKNNTYHYRRNIKLTYFRSYKSHLKVKLKLFWFEKNKNKLFLTFQSLEMAKPKTQTYILNWLNKKLK